MGREMIFPCVFILRNRRRVIDESRRAGTCVSKQAVREEKIIFWQKYFYGSSASSTTYLSCNRCIRYELYDGPDSGKNILKFFVLYCID